MTRTSGASMLVLFSFLLSPVALAQDGEPTGTEATTDEADLARAVVLFTNGKTLFEEANYEDAITAWSASYELSKKPVLLFNLASAYERLARYDEAVDALNKYRAFATDEERDAIERRMKNLEKLAAEQKVKDDQARLAASLQPGDGTDMPPAKPKLNPRRPIGYGLIALGAAGVATGAGLGVASGAAAKKADANCFATDGGGLCLNTASDDLSRNSTFANVADVSFIVGGIAAVTGVVLVVTTPSTTVSAGFDRVTFSGRF